MLGRKEKNSHMHSASRVGEEIAIGKGAGKPTWVPFIRPTCASNSSQDAHEKAQSLLSSTQCFLNYQGARERGGWELAALHSMTPCGPAGTCGTPAIHRLACSRA